MLPMDFISKYCQVKMYHRFSGPGHQGIDFSARKTEHQSLLEGKSSGTEYRG